MPHTITPDHFPWFDYQRYSFSLGVEEAGWAYLSGHSASAYDPDKHKIVVTGDMAAQTRTAYAKAERILDAAGYTLDEVVHIVENVTVDGIDHYQQAAQVRQELFGGAGPTVSTVLVQRLLRPTAWIEVELTATRHDGRRYRTSGRGSATTADICQAGGLVFLPTLHPYDDDGNLVGIGDVGAQVDQIFANAQRLLEAVDLNTNRIVKTLEMIRPEALPDYKATGRVRRKYLGPTYPAAAGIIQPRVANDDRILISYDFIAATEPATAINPGWDRYQRLTYSPAVAVGDMVLMSGQAALDPETEQAVHPGNIVAQADYTYRNIINVLEAAGLGPQHLVRTVEYVTNDGLSSYRGVADVRRQLLTEPYPASTGIVCGGLLRPEFQIEIDPTAMSPRDEV